MHSSLSAPKGTRVFSSLLVPELDENGRVESVLSVAWGTTKVKRFEEAYRTLGDNSLQDLAIIQDGRIVFCNKALAALSGYSRGESRRLSPVEIAAVGHSATAIYRIVQEALTNISRHASASRVSVLLREVDERLEVLIGIRERAQGLGGKVSVLRETGKGTSVAVSIPYPGGGNLA